MKVLIVSTHYPLDPSDLSRSFVRDEAQKLAERGVEVHVVHWSSVQDVSVNKVFTHNVQPSPVAISFGIKNVLKFPVSSFFHLKTIGILSTYAEKIVKIARKHRVNIIHAHFACIDGFSALLAKGVTKKPLVISVWGEDVQADTKSGYGLLLRKYTRDLVVKALNGADAITVGADSHYKTVARLVGKDKISKIFLIPLSLDIRRFSPSINGHKIREKYHIQDHQPVILFARHLRPIYGAEYLIRAAAKVVHQHPRTVFLILGDGPLRTDLQELTRRMGVNRNVIFTGNLPKTEMPFYHAASNIFVDPCIFGQGSSSLEALSCGKPVIGFNTGQIKIVDGVDGFLVETGNIEELADRILWLVEHPHARREIGAKGRERVKKQHNLEGRVDQILKIYDEVL